MLSKIVSVPRNGRTLELWLSTERLGSKSKDKGEGPIATRIHQPLGRRRAGNGSDLGWLASLPRFCHQLAALRRPDTDDSVMYFQSITFITSDRIPSSQSSTHNENTTLSRPPIYSIGLHPAPQLRYLTFPDHQCRPHNTFLLLSHTPCRRLRRYIRRVRQPLHAAKSQLSTSGIRIGQLECGPEQDPVRF